MMDASEIAQDEIKKCNQKAMSNIYKQSDFIELRNKVPNVKCSVLICDDHQCTNYNDINTTIIDGQCTTKQANNWLLHLKCKICFKTWSICTQCSQFKKKLTNNRMINLHRASYHCEKNNKRKHDQMLINTNGDTQIINTVTEVVHDNSLGINDDHLTSINTTVNISISNICQNENITSHEPIHNDVNVEVVDDIIEVVDDTIVVVDDTIEVFDDIVNIVNDKNVEDNMDIIEDNVCASNAAMTLDVDSIRKRLISCNKTTMYLNNPTHQIYYEDQIQKKENIHCLSEKTKSVRIIHSVFAFD
jgi:hypothetical protein